MIRWGILGAGRIAGQFADAFRVIDHGEVVGLAARDDATRARDRADELGIPDAFGGYDTLLDPERIDAVYICTPHHNHAEWTIKALNRGIPVLVEKPMTVNAAEGKACVDAARMNKVFLMEALWTRHLPAVQQAKTWLDEGCIGSLQKLYGSFRVSIGDADPSGRLLNPDLAGGSLLDLGVYVASTADFFIGEDPLEVHAESTLGPSGVDEQSQFKVSYPGFVELSGSCSFREKGDNHFELVGTAGRIILEAPFWSTSRTRLESTSENREEHFLHETSGFEYQIRAAQQAISEGRIECPTVPHESSLRVLRILDILRDRIGLRYPFETL